jgi:hypothetical protein
MVTTITTTLAVGVCTTAIALSAGRIYLASPRLDLSGPRFDLRAATPTAVGRNGIPPSPPPPPAPLAMGIWSATPCGIAAAAPIRRRLACYLQLATAAATGTAAITTTVAATRIAACDAVRPSGTSYITQCRCALPAGSVSLRFIWSGCRCLLPKEKAANFNVAALRHGQPSLLLEV